MCPEMCPQLTNLVPFGQNYLGVLLQLNILLLTGHVWLMWNIKARIFLWVWIISYLLIILAITIIVLGYKETLVLILENNSNRHLAYPFAHLNITLFSDLIILCLDFFIIFKEKILK